MQTKAWALAVTLALASTALAESRPRIYFPRNVKRQFFNSTTTREDAFPPLETTSTPERSFETSDIGFPLAGSSDEDGFATVFTTTEDESDVLTLSIPTTVLVIPTDPTEVEATESEISSTGGLPATILQPTATTDTPLDDEDGSTGDNEPLESSDTGILLAPTGIVTSSSSSQSSDPPEQPTSEAVQEDEDTLDLTAGITAPGGNPTEATTDPTDDTELPVETDTEQDETFSSTPTEDETASATDDTAEETSAPPVDDEPTTTDILDPIETIASSITDEASSMPVVNETDSVGSGTDVDPTLTDDLPLSTNTPTEDNSGDQPDETGTSAPEPSQTGDPDSGETTETTTDGLPSITSIPGTSSDTDPTSVPGGDATTDNQAPSEPTSEPSSGVDLPADPTSSGSDPGPTVPSNSTSTITTPPDNAPTNAVTDDGGDDQSLDSTTFTSIPIKTTVKGKDEWLGTKLAADDAPSTAGEDVPAPTESSETLPPGTPKTIDAQEEEVPKPAGTMLIRIVFDHRLHYEFVADNYTAAQQIFTYLPEVLAFGEGITTDQIKMTRLAPESQTSDRWFPTAAFAYIPVSVVDSLKADILLPNSALYHHDFPIARELASTIDPKFGIFPGSEVDNGIDETDPGGAPFSNNDDIGEEQSPEQQGATVGIAFGAVSVAVAYGAAMFLVARRYKRKRQGHRRTSSIINSSDMRYSASGSPAVMGGALLSRDFSCYGGVASGARESQGTRESQGSGRSGRSGAGNSGRTAYISAPFAAENSLGWN